MNPETNAVINQWSSDVDRLERELAKARERIAELEKKLKCQESATSFWQNYGASDE